MATATYAGPVDYLVFALPPGAAVGAGLRKVLDRVDEGNIELLDVEVVRRDERGQPVRVPLTELPPSSDVDLAEFDGVHSGILDAQDLAAIAANLEPGDIAIAIVYEDRSLAAAADAWAAVGGAELFSGGVDIADLAVQLGEGDDE